MAELALDEITLHYEMEGSGPPLLLIAGMMSDSASWGALLPLLTPHFTVVRPDNRTTGRTRPWTAPASVQHYARDAIALMHHLGFARFHLAGHSMGGLTALQIAGLMPNAVASLSILTSAPVQSPRTMAVFDSLLATRQASPDTAVWLRALYPWIFQPDFFADPNNTSLAIEAAIAYPHAQTIQAMAHQLECLRASRPLAELNRINAPTLVLYAENDILIPEVAARQAFAAIPNVTQITIPNAGHSIHWDAPAAVADQIIGFASPDKL